MKEDHLLIQHRNDHIADLQVILSDRQEVQTCSGPMEDLQVAPMFSDIPLEARKAILILSDQLEVLTLSNRQGALMHAAHPEVPVLIVHQEVPRSNGLAEVQVFSVPPGNHQEAQVLRDRAVQVQVRKAEEDSDLPLFFTSVKYFCGLSLSL